MYEALRIVQSPPSSAPPPLLEQVACSVADVRGRPSRAGHARSRALVGQIAFAHTLVVLLITSSAHARSASDGTPVRDALYPFVDTRVPNQTRADPEGARGAVSAAPQCYASHSCDTRRSQPCQFSFGMLVCSAKAICCDCTSDDDCSANFVCRVREDDDGLQYNACVFKELFTDFRASDGIGTFLTFLGGMLAASSGIGGGGLFVPLFILIMKMHLRQATALSQVTIAGGAIANFLILGPQKHPSRSRPLIDYDAALLLMPGILCGTVIGVILNRIFPSWLTVSLLIIVLILTAIRTVRKGVKLYVVEKKSARSHAALARGPAEIELAPLDEDDSALDSVHGVEDRDTEGPVDTLEAPIARVRDRGHGSCSSSTPMLPPEVESGSRADVEADAGELPAEERVALSLSLDSTTVLTSRPRSRSLEEIEKAESAQYPLGKMGIAALAWIVVLLIALLRGGHGAPSVAGIACGTPEYWVVTAATLPALGMIAALLARSLYRDHMSKLKVAYSFAEGDVKWTKHNIIRFPLFAVLAGTLAGLMGIGGGMVLSPLLLEIGMVPTVGAATSAFTILLETTSTTVQFVILGALESDYAVWFGMVGMLSAFTGQTIVKHMVKRYGKTSYIVLSLALVIVVATVLMGVTGIMNVVRNGVSGFRSLCGHN